MPQLAKLTLGILVATAASGQHPLAWRKIAGGRVELREQDKPVLVYNYGPQLRPGAPENRRRCCYVFPLYTPAGVSPLDDFPSDHWHHRGIFWAWPIVETEGGSYDLWMETTAKHVAEGEPEVSASSAQAQLKAHNLWRAGGRDIVREQVQLIVYPAQGNSRELDFQLRFEARHGPVTLRGSAEKGKSYGGFNVRFAPRENQLIRADGITLHQDEDLNPRRWAELEAVYQGKRALLRVTPAADNPGAPHQWTLRAYGFIGAAFPGRTAQVDGYTLKPGAPLTLRFRVRVADLP